MKTSPGLRFLEKHDMVYEQAPKDWLLGIPLGNGHIGAMLWGSGSPLRVTLDKYDLWETREIPHDPEKYRYQRVKELVRQGRLAEVEEALYTLPPGDRGQTPYPTRLPLPRMEIHGVSITQGRLRLADATWDGGTWQAFVHAEKRLLVIRGLPQDARISVDYPNERLKETLKGWGYPDLERGRDRQVAWVRQRFPFGGEYVIAWTVHEGVRLVSIASHRDAREPLLRARADLESSSFDTLHGQHRMCWETFWKRSRIQVPDPILENLYYVEMYKLGSSVRPDGYPITLRGIWTVDGGMPPWSGDYHLDLNIQESYWPVYASNHTDLGMSLYEHFFRWLPRFQQDCREFFGVEGAWAKCAIGLDAVAISAAPRTNGTFNGWQSLSCWTGGLPWVCHHYWLHYRYTLDRKFLRDRVLPMLKAAWKLYDAILAEGKDGRLHFPASASPEYDECTERQWKTDTSCDAALIRFVCRALIEADDALGAEDPDRTRYERMAEKLYDYPGTDEFWISADTPVAVSHRHFSHLFAVHPFDLVTIEGTQEDRARIEKSLETLIELGMGRWAGHSFPEMSLIASRAGKPEMAWFMLRQVLLFVEPNSLHRNGDPRRFGMTRFSGNPITLEAGFAAAAAILEMLLQSWHGIIRVFPAVPPFWPDASFRNLLAEGAVQVSAERRDGRVRRIELKNRFGGTVKVKNVFGGPAIVDGKEMDGTVLEIPVQPRRTVRIVPAAALPALPKRNRRDAGTNWFGIKRIPRF